MSYLIGNQYGVFCSACGEQVGIEEIDWDCCDTCGGAGFGEEDDEDYYDYDPPHSPDSTAPDPSRGGR
jgi:hypothetical protein